MLSTCVSSSDSTHVNKYILALALVLLSVLLNGCSRKSMPAGARRSGIDAEAQQEADCTDSDGGSDRHDADCDGVCPICFSE